MTCRLTVLTPIHLKSESNPPSGVPVERNQTKITRYLWVFKFILDHSVSITVARKNLELHKNMLSCLISKIILKQYVHTNSTFAILKKNGDSTLSSIKLIISIDPNCRPPKQKCLMGTTSPITWLWQSSGIWGWHTSSHTHPTSINREDTAPLLYGQVFEWSALLVSVPPTWEHVSCTDVAAWVKIGSSAST